MPSKHFALESGGPERLELAWEGAWKNLAVSLDGRPLGSFEGQKDLKEGQEFRLEDGSTLRVQLSPSFLAAELTLTRDGEPLPGSAADPAQRLAGAAGIIFFIAGFNIVLGLVAAGLQIRFLQSLGLGFGAVVSGIVYGVLGFFVKRRSTAALSIAVVLFIVDGILFVVGSAQSGHTPNVGGLVARVFFLIPMIRGFAAIKALKAAPRRRPGRRPVPTGASPTAGAPAVATAPPRPAPVRVLTGDAERRRLELSTTHAPQVAVGGPARRIDLTTRSAVDSAAAELRFVARKLEITPQGLRAAYPDGKAREAAWAQVGAIVIRLLPPDPPWNAQPLLDVVVPAADGGSWETVRVFSTTLVNYGAIPGGGSTSRLENTRRLGSHIAAQNPAMALDTETAAFLKDGKPPARFVNMTHFAEYDARYK